MRQTRGSHAVKVHQSLEFLSVAGEVVAMSTEDEVQHSCYWVSHGKCSHNEKVDHRKGVHSDAELVGACADSLGQYFTQNKYGSH